MDGIICINKPQGWTSFDIVAKMRGITKIKKIGHGGTLDPMATGVLPVFLGKATKVCDILPADDKGYLADLRFGMTTDTLDITGTVLTEQQPDVSEAALHALLPRFTGEISQLPPMYSAVQVNGKRLYELARQGKTAIRKPRSVTIHSLSVLAFDKEALTARLEVTCSKGTYIRTLVDDIGRELGCGAVLTGLTRHIAGVFALEQCYSLEQIQELADRGILGEHVVPVERVFEPLPEIMLNDAQARMFCNGVKLDLERVVRKEQAGEYRVYGPSRLFLGTAFPDYGTMELRIGKLFVTGAH